MYRRLSQLALVGCLVLIFSTNVQAAPSSPTFSPAIVSVGAVTEITLNLLADAEIDNGESINLDFPGGLKIATCTVPTVDVDADGVGDGTASISSLPGEGQRYSYTVTGNTTQAVSQGLHLCVQIQAASAANHRIAVTAGDTKLAALLYAGSENQVNITANVDNALTFDFLQTVTTNDPNGYHLNTTTGANWVMYTVSASY